jgi:hypothetical protein
MEAAHFFKIVVALYQTTRSQIPEQMCYVIVLFDCVQGNRTGTAEKGVWQITA